jgi:small subunit ribosomal protein S6
MLAIRGSLIASESEEVFAKIKKTLEKHGGKLTYEENWGVLNLAYSIKKEEKAHYYVLRFEISPAEIQEIERKLEINPDLIRYLTTKVESEEIFTKEMYDQGLEEFYQRREERQKVSKPKTRATTSRQLEEEMKKIKKEKPKLEKKIDDILAEDLSL